MCAKYKNHSRSNTQQNRGELYDFFQQQKNLHFDNKQDIHMRSKNYKESDWGLDIGLLTTQGMRLLLKVWIHLGAQKGY